MEDAHIISAGYTSLRDSDEAKIIRYVDEHLLEQTDEQLRNFYSGSDEEPASFRMFYGPENTCSLTNRGNDLTYVHKIKDVILRDFPDRKDEDIHIHIPCWPSRAPYGCLLLYIYLPADEFIQFRKKEQLHEL
jgi:hypothetical protein